MPRQPHALCDRENCPNAPVRRVKSGGLLYRLCEPHAKEIEVFEESFAELRAGMKAYYAFDPVPDREALRKGQARG